MFETLFDQYNWDEIKTSIYSKTAKDVERALGSFDKLRMMLDADLDDFCALISPAAAPYLEQMAQISH